MELQEKTQETYTSESEGIDTNQWRGESKVNALKSRTWQIIIKA
jgi:hypothetical protein